MIRSGKYSSKFTKNVIFGHFQSFFGIFFPMLTLQSEKSLSYSGLSDWRTECEKVVFVHSVPKEVRIFSQKMWIYG